MAKRRLKMTKAAKAARARYRKNKAGRGRGRRTRRKGGDLWGSIDHGVNVLGALSNNMMQLAPMLI